MPIGSNPPVRGAGRPPWAREGPKPIPMPAAPWTLNRRGQQQPEEAQASEQPAAQKEAAPRKTTKISITPTENGAPKQTTAKLQSREIKVPIVTEKPATKITTIKRPSVSEPKPILKHVEPEPEPEPKPVRTQSRPIKDKEEARETIDKAIPMQKVKSLVKQDSIKGPPIGPPLPPPPPPPPPNAPPPDFEKTPISEKQAKRLQMLRSRPRRRPDWTDMMKEVESGRKLNHVQCNDRSGPILSKSMLFKAKGQFVYESEKDNVHNKLLKQIQFGVPLKKVKCNDRSKPILDGLRKFRRQMTIEEQIIKSQSQANLSEPPVEEDEVDEMDDIDKVRDDLQSTKQLLALELRNKEAQDRENKRLLARIQNLEAELELEKTKVKGPVEVRQVGSAPDETLIKALKNEATFARKTAEDLEVKYQKAAEMLDNAKSNLEEQKKQNAILQQKLQQALQGCQRIIQEEVPRSFKQDKKETLTGGKQDSRRTSEAAGALTGQEPEEEEEEEQLSESESDSEDDEETRKERAEKRLQREIKMLSNKLKTFKDKQAIAKKERIALKESLKKQHEALKEEKKKYKVLQKEVDKMAALMKEGSDEEDEEEPEEESETESEEESSESEESESESESESEDEDTTNEQKRTMLSNRAKRHEGILNALKKGNYLLKANVDRQKDDLNKQREMSISLQEDLNSVLSELG